MCTAFFPSIYKAKMIPFRKTREGIHAIFGITQDARFPMQANSN